MTDKGEPIEWKKYQTYHVKVDPDQDDRGTEIKLFSFARPHMRSFHTNWIGFMMAFFIWFSIAPLLPEIRASLSLTKKEIWTSNIVAVAGTIFMRFLMGPLCDKFGSRILFSMVLIAASIPTAMTGLVNSPWGFAILRLFIGIAGSTFVMCQYWTTRMFSKNIVGTANAVVAGWGNLGAGVTHLVIGSLLFPMMKNFFGDDENKEEKAWRTVFVIPALFTTALGVFMVFCTDDAPKGNFWEMKRHGCMAEVSAADSFRQGFFNFNTWILFIHYGACFGMELTMSNDEFGQTTESAAAIASLFGWMNVFARALGGYSSDVFNRQIGMRGRIMLQTFLLLGEGIMVFVFANTHSLGAAIVCLVFFSLFVQAADGSTFGIVPYIDPHASGTISGIVGAGGNVGAVSFSMCFRELEYKPAFYAVGYACLGAAFMSVFINIKGCSSLFFGKDTIVYGAQPAATEKALMIPEAEVKGVPTSGLTKAVAVEDYDDYDATEVEA